MAGYIATEDCEDGKNVHNSYVRRFWAQKAMRELAGTRLASDPIKQLVIRLSRQTGLKKSRCYEIWYGRAKRIEDFEETQIRAALDKKRKVAARNELAELRSRIERLESLLRQTDPDFHSEALAALRDSPLRTD